MNSMLYNIYRAKYPSGKFSILRLSNKLYNTVVNIVIQNFIGNISKKKKNKH